MDSIIKRLRENRKDKLIKEASFQSGGSTYSCAFGRYSKDGQPISRDEYFKAKEETDNNTPSSNTKGEDVKVRDFSQTDYYGYSGSDLPNGDSPKIAEIDKDGEYSAVILSGDDDSENTFISIVYQTDDSDASSEVGIYLDGFDESYINKANEYATKIKNSSNIKATIKELVKSEGFKVSIDGENIFKDDDNDVKVRDFSKTDHYMYGGANTLPNGDSPKIVEVDKDTEYSTVIVSGDDYSENTFISIIYQSEEIGDSAEVGIYLDGFSEDYIAKANEYARKLNGASDMKAVLKELIKSENLKVSFDDGALEDSSNDYDDDYDEDDYDGEYQADLELDMKKTKKLIDKIDSEEKGVSREDLDKMEKGQSESKPNKHSTKYKVGDKVRFEHAGGEYSDSEATIIGYDEDGNYKYKWDDGTISSGANDENFKSQQEIDDIDDEYYYDDHDEDDYE